MKFIYTYFYRASALEQMQLKKEWHIQYSPYPESLKDTVMKYDSQQTSNKDDQAHKNRPTNHDAEETEPSKQKPKHFIAVFSSHDSKW